MANEFILRKGLISLGGVTFPLTQVTSTYTVLTTDYFVEATSGTFTISLPTAVGIKGQVYQIKNAGNGTITVDPSGKEKGRGVYVCPHIDCINKAMQPQKLDKAFRIIPNSSNHISMETIDRLKQTLLKLIENDHH